jgi:hypothetical protein
MLSTIVVQSAISPAITIAAQALKSQEVTLVHTSGVFQNIIASCGFKLAICDHIFSSSISHASLPSNIIS